MEWSDSIKEIQRNWIGKSKGAAIEFKVEGIEDKIEVFTLDKTTHKLLINFNSPFKSFRECLKN